MAIANRYGRTLHTCHCYTDTLTNTHTNNLKRGLANSVAQLLGHSLIDNTPVAFRR